MAEAREERARIAKMFERADGLRDWPGSYFPAVQEAQDGLAAWAERYPEEAAAERAHTKARHQAEAARRAKIETDPWQ